MGIQFTGLASGLDTQSIIADLMKVERTRVTDLEKQKTLVEWQKDAYNELNTKIYSFYKTELFEFKSSGTYNKKSVSSSNTSVVTVNSSNGAANGTHAIDVTTMAQSSFLTGTELGNDLNGDAITSTTQASELINFADPDVPVTLRISLDGGTNYSEISVESDDTVAEIIAKFDDLELDMNISYDSNFNRIFVSSTETGAGVQIQFDGEDGLLDALGFADNIDPLLDNRSGTAGVDASFSYNGTDLTSSSNTITVNGLSFNIVGEGASSTVSVSNDVDAMYESVKNFVTKYNELIDEINTKLDAESAREYEPLTDEEKQAMTDDDVSLWEARIKSSLLRRDTTLTSMYQSTRSILTTSYSTSDTGSTFTSLSDIGIVTGNYTEKGKLHIKGDEDDSLYSLNTNTLKEALESDSDEVMDLLTHIGDTLYADLTERMKSTTLSSAFNIFNDKKLTNDMLDYDEQIYDMEDRLSQIESRYYAQFTAMEQAIQRANSTGEWLAQQLGGM